MTAAVPLLLALLGAMVGSFVTVVAYRVPRSESVVVGRSQCPGCGARIAAYDNVPIVSWALLHGRSRCCRLPISRRYPLAEAALAALYAAVALRFHDDLSQLLLGLVFVAALVAVTLTDLERRIIPNKILAVVAVLGLALTVVLDPGSLPERGIAALGAGGVLFLAALAYLGGMGLGDVKLAAVMGLFLGFAVIPALLVALLAGSVVGVALIVRQGAAARKRALPFGPFLALGGVTALLVGQEMLDAYTRTFA